MKKAGVWAGIALLAFAATIFYQSLSLDYSTPLGPGPGFFPRWLSGLLIALTLVYIASELRNSTIAISEVFPSGEALGKTLAMLGGLIVFMLIVSYAGFVISGSILMTAMLIKDFKWHTALAISLAVSVSLLFLFQTLLGVTLPVNDFGW